MVQKFKRGDVVHIASDLGESMFHFPKDKDVVIMYSYAERYGGSNIKDYSVLDFDGSTTAWYYESQLTFLRYGGLELISKIIKESEEKQKVESDLNWIVANWGKKIKIDNVPAASINKLMLLIGITKSWGRHGEGVDYYRHIKYTIECLGDVLLTGDIEKVKKFITEFPKINEFIFSSDFHGNSNEFRKPIFVP